MATAIIELVQGRSLSARGRTLIKGYPQTITDAADINYYKSVAAVRVTQAKQVKPKAEVKPKVQAPQEEAADTLSEKPEEIQQEAQEEKVEKVVNPESKKTKKVAAYSEDELKTKKKKVLIEIAASLGVYVDDSDKRKEIIAAIMNVQNSEE